jgi:hypothetical protein
VGAGLPAMAAYLLANGQLNHRYRRQASSHPRTSSVSNLRFHSESLFEKYKIFLIFNNLLVLARISL